jgi:hypothetical protein
MEGTDVEPIRKPINQISHSDNVPSMSLVHETKKEDNSEHVLENQSLRKEIEEFKTKLEAERRQNEEHVNRHTEYLSKIEELTSLNHTLTERVKELETKVSSVTIVENTEEKHEENTE